MTKACLYCGVAISKDRKFCCFAHANMYFREHKVGFWGGIDCRKGIL